MKTLVNISKALTLILSITLVSGCDDVGGSNGSNPTPAVKSVIQAGSTSRSGGSSFGGSNDNTNTFYIVNRTTESHYVIAKEPIDMGISPPANTRIYMAPGQTVKIEGWDVPNADGNDLGFNFDDNSISQAFNWYREQNQYNNPHTDFYDTVENASFTNTGFTIIGTTINSDHHQERAINNNVFNSEKHSISYFYLMPKESVGAGFTWNSYIQPPVVNAYRFDSDKNEFIVSGTFISDGKVNESSSSDTVIYGCRVVNESGVLLQQYKCETNSSESAGSFTAHLPSVQGMNVEIQAYLQSTTTPTESNSLITAQVSLAGLAPSFINGMYWPSSNNAPSVTGISTNSISGIFISDAIPESTANKIAYKALVSDSTGKVLQTYDATANGTEGDFSVQAPITLPGQKAYLQIQAYIGESPTPSTSITTPKTELEHLIFKNGGDVKLLGLNTGVFSPSDLIYTGTFTYLHSAQPWFKCAVTDKNGVTKSGADCEINSTDESDGTRVFSFASGGASLTGYYLKVSACEDEQSGEVCVDSPLTRINDFISFDLIQYTNSESISYIRSHNPVPANLAGGFNCKIKDYTANTDSPKSTCSTEVDESGNLKLSFTVEPTSTKKQLQVFGISDPKVLAIVDLTMPWVATFSLYDTTDKTKAYIRINIDSTEHNIDAEPFTCQLQDSNTKTASSGTNPNCAITSMGLFQLATVTGISPGTNQHVTISRAALKNTDTGAPYTQTQLVDLP